jgi:hypothetical protein
MMTEAPSALHASGKDMGTAHVLPTIYSKLVINDTLVAMPKPG